MGGSRVNVILQGSGRLFLSSQRSILHIGPHHTLHIDGPALEGLRNGRNGSTQDNNNPVVRIQNGEVTMSRGSISGNTNSMVGGIWRFGGGVLVESHIMGSGILEGRLTMTGGIIKDNRTVGNGGGVLVNGGIFIMQGNAEVSGNHANLWGGGVFVMGNSAGPWANTRGIFYMMENATVSGNHAENGGGVFVDPSGNSLVTFRISNGIIHGSSAAVGIRNTAGWGAMLHWEVSVV